MDANVPSLADIAAVTRNNDDRYGNDWCGGGGYLWIIVLFLIMGIGNGGNGWFGNGGNGVLENAMLSNPLATQADVQRGFDQQTLISKIDQQTYGIADATYALNSAIKDAQYATGRDIQTVAAAQQQCCCETKQEIMQNRFEAEKNTAAINANTTAQVQKVLDAICGNRMADMQSQINQLQLQSALCGVVRYPNATTYNAGYGPFFYSNNGCGCGNGGYGYNNI